MAEKLKMEKLDAQALNAAFDFLGTIFSNEQHIPKELIPLQYEEQHWWCIKKDGCIVGTVAAWNEGNEWHWGRLGVDSSQRRMGLGKKLAITSFSYLFGLGIDEIVIDARDITVELLLSLGGQVTGITEEFYGFPITPMRLKRVDFLESSAT